MNLPDKYLDQMSDLLKEEYPLYLEAMKQESFSCIRINTDKISVEEFVKISPFELKPVPWCAEGFYVNEDARPGTHPYYYAGLYYIQEPSAMAPAAVLPVESGNIVLDACAAPGGKSTALACKLHGTGVLVSNDISASRQNATLKNMTRFGIENSYVIAEDLNNLAKRFPEYFDKILLDAPCSGEGMFRKELSLITSWLEKDSSYYAPLQKELIINAWKMLKPGGKMVYSTCTFDPCEDEEIIAALMEQYDDVIIEKSDLSVHFASGVRPGFENCMRLYPHQTDAVEVFNSSHNDDVTDLRARFYADSFGLPFTSGSDSHSVDGFMGGGVGVKERLTSVHDYIRLVRERRVQSFLSHEYPKDI